MDVTIKYPDFVHTYQFPKVVATLCKVEGTLVTPRLPVIL